MNGASPGSSLSKYSVVMMVPVIKLEGVVHVPYWSAVQVQPPAARQLWLVPARAENVKTLASMR